MKPPVTMDDIARATGLSKMTVSRALSNRGYVSAATRRRVLAATKRLDYQVNFLASQLSRNRTNLIGVIVPFDGLVGTHYFGQVMLGLQQGLAGTDYHVAIFDSLSENFNDGQKCAQLCRQKRVDGLIVIAPHRSDRFPRTFANLNMPLIVVGSSPGEKSVSSVDIDNSAGATDATEHLIRLGHLRIGFLGGPAELRDATQRERAFRRAMARHKVPVVERWIVQGEYETRRAFHLALDMLTRKDRPSAIFAANDLMAFGVIDAARVLGLAVPDALSVVGFDDVAPAAESVPALTTVRHPMRQLGRVAAEYLLQAMNRAGTPALLHQQLHAELIVRSSTGGAPKTVIGAAIPFPRLLRLN